MTTGHYPDAPQVTEGWDRLFDARSAGTRRQTLVSLLKAPDSMSRSWLSATRSETE